MAAIQPKNTDEILVNKISEKTPANNVNISDSFEFVDGGAAVPVSATIDIGTSTAAEHVQEAFVKTITSNGQALTLGTESDHNLDLKQTDLTRFSLTSSGLEQDATNGGSIIMSKASTAVVPGLAQTALTAAGTTISDAYQMTGVFHHFTTVAASSGAKLWNAPLYTKIELVNSGANALALYPPDGSGTINGGGAGSAVSIAVNGYVVCVKVSATNWICREITSAAA